MQPYTQNKYLGDTFLSSKYFNVDYLFSKLSALIHHIIEFIFGSGSYTGGITIRGVFAVFVIFFLTVIAYCAVRLLEIRAKEHKHLQHEIAEYAHHLAIREKKKQTGDMVSKNPRWVEVIHYIFSPNQNDWKLAIIEADSMLEALLTDLGFKGATLGDKLKSADRDKFQNLTAAWEVHTVRNQIAHEGTAFEISQYEAKRIIALYEQIFREFAYI
ncbi:hypothetical protein K2P96_01400 [Patescibacteria group bacterium]|nr:hypothetical protein [Patescibacteria group bacterium]